MDYTDDDIFEMYANQADRQYLHAVTVEQLAADLRRVDNLSQETALEFAQAIKRVVNGENQ